jgi:hypothetical protein
MISKTRRLLLGTLAGCAAVFALESVYLVGYRRGSEAALDWNFSAVVGGKVVGLGSGSALLRSKVDSRPIHNVNIVSAPLTASKIQP